MTPMSESSRRGAEDDGDSRDNADADRGTARPPQADRLQPGADPLGQPGCALERRRGGAVRRRDLDPGGGQRRLPLRRLVERRRRWSHGPTRSSAAWPAASPSRCATAARTRTCAPPAWRPASSLRRARARDDLPHAAPRRARRRRRHACAWSTTRTGVRDFIAVNAEAYATYGMPPRGARRLFDETAAVLRRRGRVHGGGPPRRRTGGRRRWSTRATAWPACSGSARCPPRAAPGSARFVTVARHQPGLRRGRVVVLAAGLTDGRVRLPQARLRDDLPLRGVRALAHARRALKAARGRRSPARSALVRAQ